MEKISRALGILSAHNNKGVLKSCRNRSAKTVWRNKDITMQSNRKYSLHDITNEPLIKEEGNEHYWTKPVSSESFSSAYVWMLDADDLADIEDAAVGRRRNIEGLCVVEPASSLSCSASCYNKDIVGLRTSVCWQQHCASTAFTYCSHSFCCAGMALRTIQALPESSALCKKTTRTRQSEGKDFAYSGSEKSDQETARVLQFLSLSGCYQITDHGLR